MQNKTNGFFESPIDPSDPATSYENVYKEFGDKIPYTKVTFKVEGVNHYLQSIDLQ